MVDLPNLLPQFTQLRGLENLPLCGVLVILGIVFLIFSGIPAKQLVTYRRIMCIIGSALILLGPIIYFAIIASVFNNIATTLGTGDFISFLNPTLGIGTYMGLMGGALGIIAGILAKKQVLYAPV